MDLYTRHGDDGTTGLFGGDRVSKSDPRIAAIGDLDELNAAIGLAVCAAAPEVREPLLAIQSQLFDLGANLATRDKQPGDHIPPLAPAHVQKLESLIDRIDGALPPLRVFILPGGCEAAARLHHARAVCRRAERSIVTLHAAEPVNTVALQYINRLADLLFAMARRANQIEGVEDIPWRPADDDASQDA